MLLVNDRTRKWIKYLNQKLINNYIDIRVLYYKVIKEQSINPYGEIENEEYLVSNPITLKCLMVKDDENKEFTEGTIGILNDSITFMFLKDMLPEGIMPTEGDIIVWGQLRYELSRCWDGNLWAEEKLYLYCTGNLTTRNLAIESVEEND